MTPTFPWLFRVHEKEQPLRPAAFIRIAAWTGFSQFQCGFCQVRLGRLTLSHWSSVV